MQIVEKDGKMKYNTLLDTLQNLINYKPKQSELCKVLGYNASTVGARAQRNSNFSDEEIAKIEDFYKIELNGKGNANTVELDYYPDVYGSCGNGSIIFEESPEKISVTKSQIHNYSTSDKYTVINARGLSMYPLICDMDKLIVKQHNGEQIIDNDVYVFNYNGEIFIKRLVKNIDQIVCISENKDFENRPITPTEQNFKILGKVVGLFRERV